MMGANPSAFMAFGAYSRILVVDDAGRCGCVAPLWSAGMSLLMFSLSMACNAVGPPRATIAFFKLTTVTRLELDQRRVLT